MSRSILVLNAGSSSVKFALYSPEHDALLVRGRIERVGTPEAMLRFERFFSGGSGTEEEVQEYPVMVGADNALPFLLDLLLRERLLGSLRDIAAVGHRVVHGGALYAAAAVVDDKVLRDIEELSRFAPLHQPHNLHGIRQSMRLLRVPNVAVFDTAFHQTMKPKVYLYGISPELYRRYGIRKYGFHGTNHKRCALAAGEILGGMPRRMVTCHLGNGSSVTAVLDGKSVDTSMGFTPTDGLLMGTRSGAMDPEAVLYLLRELHKSPKKIGEFLNQESGLKAIAGTEDVRDIWRMACDGDENAKLALDMLAYRIAGFIGSYAAALNGLDCLVFTGGIGENAWYVRSEVCRQLGHLGVRLDTDRNQANVQEISAQDGKVKVLIIPADEELQIGRETRDALGL